MMRALDDYADPGGLPRPEDGHLARKLIPASSPGPVRALSATAALPPARTARGGVPDGARPGRRAEDRLCDQHPEILERLARRKAAITHGADRILPLGAGQLRKLFPHRVRTPDLQELQQASGHQPGGLRRAHLPGFAVLFFREQDDRPELRIAQQPGQRGSASDRRG